MIWMNRLGRMMPAVFLFGMLAGACAGTVTLKASKDSFFRSNERSRNSGANPVLYVAHAPGVRTLIAFDLSSVTNKIEKAVFRFRQSGANAEPIALTIAPMVHTVENAAWVEGAGTLGTTGQNARAGESCYGWRAFPDSLWEKSPDSTVVDLGRAALWSSPLAAGKRVSWEDGTWVEIEIEDPSLLERIRTSSPPVLTLGMWGASGNGLYAVHSRESGFAPELVLEVKVEVQKKEVIPVLPLMPQL